MRSGRIGIVGALAVCGVLALGDDVAAQDGGAAAPKPAAPAGGDVTAAERYAAIAKAIPYLDTALWTDAVGGTPERQQDYAAAVAGWAYLLLGTKPPAGVKPRAKELDRIAERLAGFEIVAADLYEKDPKRRAPPSDDPMASISSISDSMQFV